MMLLGWVYGNKCMQASKQGEFIDILGTFNSMVI